MSIAAQIVIALMLALGGLATGWRLGLDHEKAKQADIDKARQQTREDAQQAAADAISKIEVKQQTIVQKVQHEIQTNTVYRDCVVPADGVRLLNDAISGRGETGSAGGGAVQGAASKPE